MSKIIKFIEDNNLDFSSTGSGLNSNCVILAGYSLHLELDWFELCDELAEMTLSNDAWEELERVQEYAYVNSYENFWTTKEAKKMYKF